MKSKIKKHIINFLMESCLLNKDEIDFEENIDNLGIDSLDYVELIMEVENEFNISISDNKSSKIKTLNDLIKISLNKIKSNE